MICAVAELSQRRSTRPQLRETGPVHRAAAAVVMVVLLGCTGDARSETPSTESPGGNGPDVIGTVRDVIVAETDTVAEDVVGTAAAAVCVDRRPVVTAQMGRPYGNRRTAATIAPGLPPHCPGGGRTISST